MLTALATLVFEENPIKAFFILEPFEQTGCETEIKGAGSDFCYSINNILTGSEYTQDVVCPIDWNNQLGPVFFQFTYTLF